MTNCILTARHFLPNQLYESNAEPRLYWFVAKFFKRKGDNQPNFYRPSDTPGRFWREFALLELFFYKKTGIPWERRLMLCGTRAAPIDATVSNAPTSHPTADMGQEDTGIWNKLEEKGRRFLYELPVSFSLPHGLETGAGT